MGSWSGLCPRFNTTLGAVERGPGTRPGLSGVLASGFWIEEVPTGPLGDDEVPPEDDEIPEATDETELDSIGRLARKERKRDLARGEKRHGQEND